ncbi:4-hydroxythreonine-4-phosphate dehydrogenase PdxA [Pontibacillus yanchengensis]|uniref:4-hydroxythreonine-4-phosphate dehydrogenase PdxA n=2 Tax=Pontibacillus yanchengensis TaxID=462910 RepID=A0ACC7VGB0_9BACI|nr:4-hydroxythreonine-4-phosphate dehydrogenase PdxA [Pontibacillus yanchengensis]MYL34354.1 4-hydroxythreonine-4-phosphate dehydrogenase PdxA [Pontibacillus yanchengensis]MYL53822.1 4-hydroxythreonine-4-phosphate dehydrogenase PdxA [Pontibacillus yanchengensis]
MTSKISTIALPIGDPAGIGPEITIKALNEKEIYDICNPVVIGDRDVLGKIMNSIGVHLNINELDDMSQATFTHGTIDLVNLNNIDINEYEMGVISGMCGQASYEYIQKAIEMVQGGEAGSICTPPINKESLQAGEVPYIDHTAMLSAYTDSHDPMTMFEVNDLRIFFLTRHLSLKDAIGQMTKERVHDYLNRCKGALELLGIENPKLAVAGLNPHSGEGGLFGREEIDELAPGIERAREDGIEVYGPVPADSVFHQALHGKYDAVLSLYHDQGHIAAKMADFERTVSITNGLPFLRTSVDHGTAFDIAGEGIASSVSMVEAIKAAAKYTPYFNN